MSALSTRRLALLLLIIVPVLYFQCQPAAVPPPSPPGCPPANAHRYKPQIAVDEKTLTANPRVAVVWDVEPENPNEQPFHASNRPVKITWKTNDPNFQLDVKFDDPSCGVENLKCDKPGECTAMVKKLPAGGQNIRCTYKMFNRQKAAQKDDDSDIVIMPCCS